MLIVAHPDHLLYHPPAHAREAEDRLFGGFYNVLHQVHLWIADIIVINPTHIIYIAIKIYSNTGMKSLVDSMHGRGLCISYSRLRTTSTDFANSIICFYEKSGVVIPVQAIRGVFMTNYKCVISVECVISML